MGRKEAIGKFCRMPNVAATAIPPEEGAGIPQISWSR
ncbi:Uncharacterised protein [Mycobacteroides abscessus subsp. abscessus]|nr:Uncharacterised protein [Mycobacteroides abscessus subsp. abscessus]SKT83476.1 Uncharacterised protein [Mycobacteroides abscessus subsp. abscessus]